jgi:hypothetical protein
LSKALHYLLHYPVHQVAGILLYIGVSAIAVLRGRMEERVVGLTLLIQFLLTFVVENYARVDSAQIGLLILDSLTLLVILAVAAKFFQAWLVVCAAAQFVDVAIHVSKLLDPTIDGWIYVTASIICGYVVVLALTFSLLRRAFSRRDA